VTKTMVGHAHEKDLQLGRFKLTAVGLEITGKPTYDEWLGVGDFIKRTHRASGFWLADWLRYGDSREEWRERLGQAIDHSELSEKTLLNIRSVAAIDPSRRRDDVDFSHHVEVAPLEPEEQAEWLGKSAEHGWSVRELRLEIRASRRRQVIDGQASLEGKYRVIYADPPWLYSDNGPTEDGSLGKAERHYAGMTIEALCALPVKAHAMPNAVLWMWVTTPMLLKNPGPREVLDAWGFDYKTLFTWDKVLGMPGHYSHVVTEHLVLATRGNGQPDKPTPQPKSLFSERRTATHSEKPTAVRKMIERLYIVGPYLELFARRRVPGWDCYGNDAGLWQIQKGSDA
jgi:N6-adenosine-specific RNA methylase IME4